MPRDISSVLTWQVRGLGGVVKMITDYLAEGAPVTDSAAEMIDECTAALLLAQHEAGGMLPRTSEAMAKCQATSTSDSERENRPDLSDPSNWPKPLSNVSGHR